MLSNHFSKVSDILTSLVDCCRWYLNWHVQTWLGSPRLESSCGMFGISEYEILRVLFLVPCSCASCFLLSQELGAFNAFHSFFLDQTIATLKLWEIIDLKREQISVGSLLNLLQVQVLYCIYLSGIIDDSKWNVQYFFSAKYVSHLSLCQASKQLAEETGYRADFEMLGLMEVEGRRMMLNIMVGYTTGCNHGFNENCMLMLWKHVETSLWAAFPRVVVRVPEVQTSSREYPHGTGEDLEGCMRFLAMDLSESPKWSCIIVIYSFRKKRKQEIYSIILQLQFHVNWLEIYFPLDWYSTTNPRLF